MKLVAGSSRRNFCNCLKNFWNGNPDEWLVRATHENGMLPPFPTSGTLESSPAMALWSNSWDGHGGAISASLQSKNASGFYIGSNDWDGFFIICSFSDSEKKSTIASRFRDRGFRFLYSPSRVGVKDTCSACHSHINSPRRLNCSLSIMWAAAHQHVRTAKFFRFVLAWDHKGVWSKGDTMPIEENTHNWVPRKE